MMKSKITKLFLFSFIFPAFLYSQITQTSSNGSDNVNNIQTKQSDLKDKLTIDVNNWQSFKKLIEQGEMGGFFSIEQVEEIMTSLNEQFPELVLPVEILGKSYEGRDMKLYCFTEKSGNTTLEDESKVKVIGMVTALHHPREPMSLSMQMFLLHKILVDYHNNEEEYVNLLQNNIICLLPFVNIDGYSLIVKTFKETEKFIPIRKNRNTGTQKCSSNEIGVDLNRNYDYGWDLNLLGSSKGPCKEDYRGTAPFSEPETQAIKNFVDKYHSKIKVVLNLHAYGNLWIFPFNCYEDDTNYRTPRITSIYNDFIENAKLPENAKIGNAKKTVAYTANGEASDWLLGKYEGIIAMSPEIGIHNFKDDKFFPSRENIFPVVSSDFDGVFYMLSKLNPKIKLNGTNESFDDNRKFVDFNLFNEGYRDIPEMDIQINITITGVNEGFLKNPALPDLFIVEKDLDESTSDPVTISINSIRSEKQKEIKSLTYIAKQELTFKSWSFIQISLILPYIEYDAVYVEINANEQNKIIFNSVKEFEGIEIPNMNKKVSILLISISLAISATILIIYLTQYYLRSKESVKNNNIYGQSKPAGLEFAQIENDSESLESSRT